MAEAVRLSRENMLAGSGGPFGAVVVHQDQIIGRGSNQVTSQNDPTLHAEILAIRQACQAVGHFHLEGTTLYASCEPCPMCFGAIHWARIARVYYANTQSDAAAIGFSDAFIYDELALPHARRTIPMLQLPSDAAREAFRLWEQKVDKTEY